MSVSSTELSRTSGQLLFLCSLGSEEYSKQENKYQMVEVVKSFADRLDSAFSARPQASKIGSRLRTSPNLYAPLFLWIPIQGGRVGAVATDKAMRVTALVCPVKTFLDDCEAQSCAVNLS